MWSMMLSARMTGRRSRRGRFTAIIALACLLLLFRCLKKKPYEGGCARQCGQFRQPAVPPSPACQLSGPTAQLVDVCYAPACLYLAVRWDRLWYCSNQYSRRPDSGHQQSTSASQSWSGAKLGGNIETRTRSTCILSRFLEKLNFRQAFDQIQKNWE